MAELTGANHNRDMPAAAAQLRAIAWLRWRVLANGFRRRGGAGELIGRILILPVFAAIALAPTALAGFLAWYFVRGGELTHLAWVLWAAVALTQLLNVNLGQPGTNFDPVELIRFPMPLRRYVLVRLFFGLLSPGNILVSLMSLAVVVGITLAAPRLFFPALLAMAVFALTNILFTRMIFAWIDRWLSTRRAREVFTACIFVGSIGLQYANVRFNPGFNGNRHHRFRGTEAQPWQRFAERAHPYIAWLPPELTSTAIAAADRGQLPSFFAAVAGCTGFAGCFLAVYALRMRTEFRGENLSDIAGVPATVRKTTRTPTPGAAPPAPDPTAPVHVHAPTTSVPLLPTFFGPLLGSQLGPLLGKELLVLRRNIGLFYGLVAPVVMVFLFAGRLFTRNGSHWALLTGVAYALIGIAPMSYNSFGTEGTGAQFYFFAPVPLREVFFAKNLFTLLLALVEVVTVVAITSYVAGHPSLIDAGFAILWAVGTLLLNTTVGNLRSVAAPKRVNPGRSMNKAQSPVSAYLAMGILVACAGLGFGVELLATYLHQPWLGLALMLTFAIAATIVYARGLSRITVYALDRRDTLFEELGKKI